MSTTSDERTMYRIAPLDDNGVFLGLSLAQLILGAAAALLAAVAMVFVAVPLGAAIVVGGGGLALARHTGEPVLHQLPTVARALRQGRRTNVWLRPLPLLGPTTRPCQLPAPLAQQELLSVDPHTYGVTDIDGPVAIVRDRRAGAYAITLRIAGRQFALLEPDAQDYQLARWASVLHGFVSERPAIGSIRWSEWATPSGVNEPAAWLNEHLAREHIPDTLRSYQALLAELGTTATRHEVLLTITTNPNRIRLHKRHNGDRHTASIETLLVETRGLLGRLNAADLQARVLDPNEWARAMRLRLDPSCRGVIDRRPRTLANDTALTPPDVLPTSTSTTRTSTWVDGSVHRSYWVTDWPRLDVPGDWLTPVLGYAAHTRTITVFFEPVPRSKSRRAITAQATKIEADAAHRTEKGWRIPAALLRAARAVREREEELIAGHAELSFGAIVTITSNSDDNLDRACADTTQIAASAGIELRPLHARQDQALLATLPCAHTVIGKR